MIAVKTVRNRSMQGAGHYPSLNTGGLSTQVKIDSQTWVKRPPVLCHPPDCETIFLIYRSGLYWQFRLLRLHGDCLWWVWPQRLHGDCFLMSLTTASPWWLFVVSLTTASPVATGELTGHSPIMAKNPRKLGPHPNYKEVPNTFEPVLSSNSSYKEKWILAHRITSTLLHNYAENCPVKP